MYPERHDDIKTTPAKPKRGRARTLNKRTMRGFWSSDVLGLVLEPLLPKWVKTHRFGKGQPRIPDRRYNDAIFYVLRTACQWQSLDATALYAHGLFCLLFFTCQCAKSSLVAL